MDAPAAADIQPDMRLVRIAATQEEISGGQLRLANRRAVAPQAIAVASAVPCANLAHEEREKTGAVKAAHLGHALLGQAVPEPDGALRIRLGLVAPVDVAV